jgi:hypothetical protein
MSQEREPTRTVAVRLNDADYNRLAALRATFPGNTTTEALRWLLTSPEVDEVIRRRVRGE